MKEQLNKLFNNIINIDVKMPEHKHMKTVYDLFFNHQIYTNNANKELTHYLAIYYQINENLFKAKSYYKISAKLGNIMALNNLGKLYSNVFNDYKKAIELYDIGVKKGDSNSMCYLAEEYILNYDYYDEGDACGLYQQAIIKGNVLAVRALASINFCDQYGMANNVDEAIKLYRMAIEKNDVHAMCRLAKICYNRDYDNCANKDEAIRLYKMAINQGNLFAMCKLANIYTNHLDNINKNEKYDEGIKLYKQAIDENYSYAMVSLASLYLHQNNIDKNYDESIKLYKMAIKHGRVDAMKSLAWFYCTTNDYDLAAKYFAQYCQNHVHRTEHYWKKYFGYSNYISNDAMYHESQDINYNCVFDDCELVNDGEKLEFSYDDIYLPLYKCNNINTYINLQNVDVYWEDYLHKYWPNKEFIGEQIIMLLLISKSRNEYHNLNWMIKGITKLIIKYLATFEKKLKM